MPRFRWSFQPKIARGAHPNLRPTVCSNVHAAIWWPQAIFHIESKFLRDEPRDCGHSRPFGYIRFTTSRRKSHVFYVKPAMLKKITIVSFDQRASCRTLAIELVRQNANSTYRSKQSGHKEPSWPSGIRAAGLIWNTLSTKSWLTLTTSVRLLYNTSTVIWCINFRFNNYSIHNYDNAWHCIQYQYRWWWCSRVRCITFGAAHPSLRWAATCHVRTLLPGPEGVRSWQVLL